MNFNNIAICGGGSRGYTILGALDLLETCRLLSDVKIYCGTSIGSIIALMKVLEFRSKEIFDMFLDADMGRTVDEINKLQNIFQAFDQTKNGSGIKSNTMGIFTLAKNFLFGSKMDNILTNYGLMTTKPIINIIKKILSRKGLSKHITFSQLEHIYKTKLSICSVNLSKMKIEYFDESTPDVQVIRAIQASISIPVLFTPCKLGGDIYVDAGIVNNNPINYFKNKYGPVLGINIIYNNIYDDLLVNSSNTDIKSFYDFIFRLMILILDKAQENTEKFSRNILNIHINKKNNDHNNTNNNGDSFFDVILVDKDDASKYYNIGKDECRNFLSNIII